MADHIKEAYENTSQVGSLTGLPSFLGAHENKNQKVVEHALSDLDSWRLFRPVRHKFQRRRVIAQFPFQYLTADLADMGTKLKYTNSHYTFLLVFVDIFTKMTYLRALKNKSGPVVAVALRDILDKIKLRRDDAHLWVDRGKEFYNKDVKSVLGEFGVELYSTESSLKAVVSENKIRQVKRIFERIYFITKKNNWLPYVAQVEDNLNKLYHSAIKMRPIDAAARPAEVFTNLYSDLASMKKTPPKFKVGDTVLLARERTLFEKGYRKAFYQRPYKIIKIKNTLPNPTFVIANSVGEEQPGSFYSEQLQKIPDKDGQD
jgi:hypothetical protein